MEINQWREGKLGFQRGPKAPERSGLSFRESRAGNASDPGRQSSGEGEKPPSRTRVTEHRPSSSQGRPVRS